MWLPLKAFFKAFKDPKGAKIFVEGVNSASAKHDLTVLNTLQEEGRLVDFLKEDISTFSDPQVGAAVRGVHTACAKILEKTLVIRPLFSEGEGESVRLAEDYDRNAVKVVGNVRGKPPYTGIVRHRGWKASCGVIAAAKIEVE